MRPFALFTLALFLAAAPAARAQRSPEREGESQLPSVDFSPTAEENFQRAEKAFENEDYLEAVALYGHVKNRFPYSRFAAESELRLADTYFAQGKYREAEEAYRTFVKLHPGHAKVDYAAFRVGASAHKAIPSDHFFLPPSYEKDQSAVRGAARTLSEFIASYPESPYVAEARALVQDCTRRLQEHEMYVASFYERRNLLRAAALRLERALSAYPNGGHDDEALRRLAQVYMRLGEKEKARATLERLLKEFPQSGERAKAEDLLEAM